MDVLKGAVKVGRGGGREAGETVPPPYASDKGLFQEEKGRNRL